MNTPDNHTEPDTESLGSPDSETDSESDRADELAATLGEPWTAFVDLTAEHRPALFAFGLQLTGSPFDGEDLVHDALIRAFGTAAMQGRGIGNLRSYLFRTMSNLWIDQHRRNPAIPMAEVDGRVEQAQDNNEDRSIELRQATDRVFSLTPRERLALVLHEAFGFSHREIGAMTESSEEAVRAALYRARGRLADPEMAMVDVDRSVIDAFVSAFSAADVTAIRRVLAADVEATVFPYHGGSGADYAIEHGWVKGSLHHHHPDHEAAATPYPTRLRVVDLAGRPVIAVDRTGGDGMLLEELWLLRTDAGRVVGIDDYCFSPDVIAHVGEMLGVPQRLLGYRFADR